MKKLMFVLACTTVTPNGMYFAVDHNNANTTLEVREEKLSDLGRPTGTFVREQIWMSEVSPGIYTGSKQYHRAGSFRVTFQGDRLAVVDDLNTNTRLAVCDVELGGDADGPGVP